jgi:ATP synthase protein I
MTQVIRSVYIGEAVKLALMGTGFAAAFILVDPLNKLALFMGFILVHVAGMVAVVWNQPGTQR